jgi:RimJ/RimL family protein N-acetyltransferase
MRRNCCVSEFRVESERLTLREWRDADIDPFHAICSDPIVMATLGPLMTRDQVAALVARMQRMQSELGHCFWAMERKMDRQLIGWCGVIRGDTDTPVVDKPEAGWRMVPSAWGKGYATEAAIASVQWTFDTLPDDAVWAITSTENRASRAVMERIGMEYLSDLDFDHPKVEADSPLLRHVTYSVDRYAWTQNRNLYEPK